MTEAADAAEEKNLENDPKARTPGNVAESVNKLIKDLQENIIPARRDKLGVRDVFEAVSAFEDNLLVPYNVISREASLQQGIPSIPWAVQISRDQAERIGSQDYAVTERRFKRFAQTGDLLLFQARGGKLNWSGCQGHLLACPYSHCMMVIRGPFGPDDSLGGDADEISCWQAAGPWHNWITQRVVPPYNNELPYKEDMHMGQVGQCAAVRFNDRMLKQNQALVWIRINPPNDRETFETNILEFVGNNTGKAVSLQTIHDYFHVGADIESFANAVLLNDPPPSPDFEGPFSCAGLIAATLQAGFGEEHPITGNTQRAFGAFTPGSFDKFTRMNNPAYGLDNFGLLGEQYIRSMHRVFPSFGRSNDSARDESDEGHGSLEEPVDATLLPTPSHVPYFFAISYIFPFLTSENCNHGDSGGRAYREVELRLCEEDPWLNQGRQELISVASFSKFGLELMQFGAPMEFVTECAAFADDEIRHSQICDFMAALGGRNSAKGGGSGDSKGMFEKKCGWKGKEKEEKKKKESSSIVDVHVLKMNGSNVDRDKFVDECVMDGCIGEAISACVSWCQYKAYDGPQFVKEKLQSIVDDEVKHCLLAWKVVAWAATKWDDVDRVKDVSFWRCMFGCETRYDGEKRDHVSGKNIKEIGQKCWDHFICKQVGELARGNFDEKMFEQSFSEVLAIV